MSAFSPTGCTAVVAVLSAMALVVLDSAMVTVAVPGIARSFSASPEQAIGTLTMYQAAMVIGLLPCAALAGSVGESRLFLAGLALFTAASCGCAMAGSVVHLLVARTLQGFGAAAVMALGIALLRLELGDRRVGEAIAWNALTVAMCSAAGPVAGALVLSFATWPWLFLIKLPVAAVALGAAARIPSPAVAARLPDFIGIALHASVAVLVLAAANTASRSTLIALAIAVAAVVPAFLLLRWLRAGDDPVWPTDLLSLPATRIAVIASVLCFIAQSAGLLALSFELQTIFDAGPLAAGLVMACWPAAVALASMFANRIVKRTGSPVLCFTGGVVLGAGLLVTAAPMSHGIGFAAIGAALCGAGFGFFQVPNNRTMFLSGPVDRSAAAGGMQGTARLLGQTLGALLVGSLFANVSYAAAPRLGLVVASLTAFAAAFVSGIPVLRRAPPLAPDGDR